ncbi:MAG: MFS transporter [Gammaproteobacteria bacterium]|nr:MFS transporter [Gammaproteobacteria bacterium]
MLKYRNMPKGTLQIHSIQIFSIVGFAALLGTLNLYLQNKGMPIKTVDTLTASFFALNFLLHFLGGSLGGTYISYRGLFLASLTLQIAGLLFIAASTINIILLGMALFLTGSGLNVSCINMMLTQLFANNDLRRRTAFSVNYSCMNLGFILAYLVANFLQEGNHYHSLFIIAAAGLLLAVVIHFASWKHLNDKKTLFSEKNHNNLLYQLFGLSTIPICFLITLYLMHHANIASLLIYVVYAIALCFILYMAYKQTRVYRNRIIAYMLLIAACMIFAFVQGLLSTGLQNFVKFNTNMNLLGIHLEPSGFNLFESLFVVIFGLLLARETSKKLGSTHSNPAEKLIIQGSAIFIFAFLMVPLGILVMHITGAIKVQLFFPILLLLFTAAAEIYINTTNYAMAGELGEIKHQGLLTGYMFLNIAVGTDLSGPFSNIILGKYNNLKQISASQTNPMYAKMFLLVAAIVAIITLVYLLLAPFIRKLRLTEEISS